MATAQGYRVLPVHQRLQLRALELAHEAERMQISASRLSRAYEEVRPGPLVALPDRGAVVATYERLQEQATDRIRALDKGPHPPESKQQSPPQQAALARGVTYQVVYGGDVLRESALLSVMRDSVAAGEQARLMARIPANLMIVDDREALLILPRTGRAGEGLLVGPGRLLNVLIELFDICWELGTPLQAVESAQQGADEETDEGTRELLSLMAAGLTDESIARELGVSQRTVARRVARVQEQLAARSRFQLGIQAIRRGWFSPAR